MDFQTTTPTVEQVAAHARKHPKHGYKEKKKRGTVEVYVVERSNGTGHQIAVSVADMNDLGLWLVKLPNTPVGLYDLRVIKGVVYQRQRFYPWYALTGDWEHAKYLPVTREGLPLDYKEGK